MPIKIELTTEEQIISTPLPNHGGKYAVIPHLNIINKVKQELSKAGFEIDQAFYKSTITGNIAHGVYHLNYGDDPDMKLMYAWSNSYDKTQKFKSAIGTWVKVCGNGMTQGNMSSAARKHMGTSAQDDAYAFIEEQIAAAKEHYATLVRHKERLKKIRLTRASQAGIIGKLFADEEVLTLTQVGVVKRELDNPSYVYDSDPNSAWSLYNHLTFSLRESHPTTWLDDHGKMHEFFVNEFSLMITPKAPEPVLSTTMTSENLVEEPEIPNQIKLDFDHSIQEFQPSISTVVFS